MICKLSALRVPFQELYSSDVCWSALEVSRWAFTVGSESNNKSVSRVDLHSPDVLFQESGKSRKKNDRKKEKKKEREGKKSRTAGWMTSGSSSNFS